MFDVNYRESAEVPDDITVNCIFCSYLQLGALPRVCFVLLLASFCYCERAHGACDVTRCTDADKCVTAPDKRTCKCAVGYYGDLCEKVATMNVTCHKDSITIMVIEDFFTYYNIKMESLHLGNKTCPMHRENIAGVSYYVVRTSKEQYAYCGGKPLEKNITHITFSHTLKSDSDADGHILRDPVIKIEYKCVYPYIHSISLPFPLIPFTSETLIHMNEMEAVVVIRLYKDETYRETFDKSPLLHLRDKVYVEIMVVDPVDVFHLRVNECWAAQSPNPNDTDGSSHTLLFNGCIRDKTAKFLNGAAVGGSNGNGSQVRFSFDMFRFAAQPHDLYLHCTVQLCSSDEGESCVPECKSITKREVDTGDIAQGLLSYGPIRLDVSDRLKSNWLLSLVLPVGGIWVLGFFLLILMAIAKMANKRMSHL